MSKLKLSEINFNEDEVLVEVEVEQKKEALIQAQQKTDEAELYMQKKVQQAHDEAQKIYDEADLLLNRARDEAQGIVDKANKEAQDIKEKINLELEQTQAKKEEIIEQANLEAQKILDEAQVSAKNNSEELISKSKEEIEAQRVETIKNAYDEGYKDGLEHIQKELEEKISDFDEFCSLKYIVRDKIIKSANKDILDLIINIAKKVLLAELDGNKIDKIIKNAISLFEKKENITIILSQKYAKLLYEFQKKSLNNEIEFNFEDFKQYENFDIATNPDFDDDTIIIENLKERYDASINSQLDVIIRNIYDNSQNGKIDLNDYENEIK